MSENTTSITNRNVYEPFFDIDMYYYKHGNRRKQGEHKLRWTIIFAGRVGFVSAIVCQRVWQTNRPKTLEFLNKIVKMGLLQVANTIRAVDGRVYVLTNSGAQLFRELTQIDIPFRSSSEPITQVNQNAIMHDSILSLILTRGIQNCNADNTPAPLWKAIITELEFKRVFPSNNIKNVDALVLLTNNQVAAIELEHSFKRKQQHEKSILKFKNALLGPASLYDKVFLIVASQKIQQDTQRFYEQLLTEMPSRYQKKSKSPLLTHEEAEQLNERIIIRTKFIDDITTTFYK